MPFPVLGSNSAVAGYEIDNSLRFNDGDSPTLQFTPSSDSNEQTWTVSFWVKRSNITTSSSQMIFMTDTNLSEYIFARFCGTEVTGKADMFQVFMVEPNAREGNVRTARLFRDVSAYYHIVVRCDLTQSTAANRLRIYVNGVEETTFDTASYLNQNDDNINWNSNVKHAIGHQVTNTTTERFFDGYLAEFYNIDGQSLAPTEFGETNDNGVWIPKAYSGSYGTNGFFLEFQNSGALGTDTSGNGNNFTPNNLTATDQTTDTPTNNWCTWNPLIGRSASYATFAEGNLDADFTSGTTYFRATGSIGVTSGKWYAEIKCIDDGGNNDLKIGVEHASPDQTTIDGVHKVIESFSGNKASGGSASSYGDTYTNGDIIGVLLDMDNGTIKFSKNGTLMASGASAYTDLISAMPDSGWAFFAYGYDNANVQANFGNAPFSISSGNADANGYGNFEYAVPSGFYSLCTKNLAEYG